MLTALFSTFPVPHDMPAPETVHSKVTEKRKRAANNKTSEQERLPDDEQLAREPLPGHRKMKAVLGCPDDPGPDQVTKIEQGRYGKRIADPYQHDRNRKIGPEKYCARGGWDHLKRNRHEPPKESNCEGA